MSETNIDDVAVRLPRTYDPDLLMRDLQVLRNVPSAPQPGPLERCQAFIVPIDARITFE